MYKEQLVLILTSMAEVVMWWLPLQSE